MPRSASARFASEVRQSIQKRLPIKSQKALNEILQFAADDWADAYRIGAEEAQREIASRVAPLLKKLEVQDVEG
jgi:hypothetical protein